MLKFHIIQSVLFLEEFINKTIFGITSDINENGQITEFQK